MQPHSGDATTLSLSHDRIVLQLQRTTSLSTFRQFVRWMQQKQWQQTTSTTSQSKCICWRKRAATSGSLRMQSGWDSSAMCVYARKIKVARKLKWNKRWHDAQCKPAHNINIELSGIFCVDFNMIRHINTRIISQYRMADVLKIGQAFTRAFQILIESRFHRSSLALSPLRRSHIQWNECIPTLTNTEV